MKQYREARAQQQSGENAEDKQERIKKGLAQLGLEGQNKSSGGDEKEEMMKKRKALFANIK